MKNALAGEALIRSFRVPESGETVGGNARVMNQSCPVRDVSKQHAGLEVKILLGLYSLLFGQMLAGEQLRQIATIIHKLRSEV